MGTITVGRIFSGMTLKSSRAQVMELLLSICAQTLGAVLAIYLTAWLFGASTSASTFTDTSMQDAAIRGFLLTLILSLGCSRSRATWPPASPTLSPHRCVPAASTQ